MIDLNPEQTEALAERGKVRVIRAGPGSGKTRVFVAELERLLASWTHRRQGIAALSFTNVAADEVLRRVGGPPPAPHYVGTLDSFVWRFIIRPFSHLAGVRPGRARLIPAPLDQTMNRPEVAVGADGRARAPLFSLALQMKDGALRVLRRDRFSGKLLEVEAKYAQSIVDAKKAEWSKNGRLTHADCHALAWKLLRGPHARNVIDRVSSRFPAILMDEFQDTNHFLGRTLLTLIEESDVQALIVGDPDQAIYSFGGADKKLFDDAASLPGATARTLRTTHRFGSSIGAAASALARSGVSVVSRPGDPGRVVLIRHTADKTLDEETSKRLGRMLTSATCSSAVLLARKNAWLNRGIAGTGLGTCPLSSRAAGQLHDAAVHLRSGASSVAAGLVSRTLERLVLDDDLASTERLREEGIEEHDWRRAIRRILFCAAQEQPEETWSAWRERVKHAVEQEIVELRPEGRKAKLGPAFNKRFKRDRIDGYRTLERAASATPWDEMTIHRAKGLEFDGVIVFWPKPGGRGKVTCPSKEWWTDNSDSDEREIAYVAATRAKKLLVFCLHADTVDALQTHRPDFVRAMEFVEPP